MKTFAVVVALATAVLANPMPQAVTSAIAPQASAPAGCSASAPGSYEITVVKPGIASRDLEKRAACGGAGTLVVTLQDGIMKDAQGRTAYIASNYQFQFDGPPQAGAIYTAGFSVCGNSSVALGGSTVFYQCLSGSFYNLYNTNWAPQCSPVAMDVIACDASGAGATQTGTAVATQSSDGQPEGTSVLTQLSDAQPNGPTATAVLTQLSDAQPNGPSATSAAAVLTQLSDAQPNGPSATAIPLSQFSDGQPQMPTGLLSQLSDAQPVATQSATSPSITPFTGGAGLPVIGEMAAIAGGLAALALL